MTVLTGGPRGPLATPRAPLVGLRRAQTWLVDILDWDEQTIGPLDGVAAGSLDFSIHTEIRSSGSLTVTSPGEIDWHRIRLAIRYEFIDETGQPHSYPLGVFLPTTPATSYHDTGSTAQVEVYDKMVMLSTDGTPTTWTADKGVTVVQAVTDVLAMVGEDSRVVGPEDGGGTLLSAMAWEPGTTWLRIVNDILEAGNFFSIWVDGTGLWRLDPYVAPTARGVEWEHVEGPQAVFEAEFTHEADTFEVPNRVLVRGRAEDDETPAPFAVAENTNPDDPLSIPSRGRVVMPPDAVIEEQDATSEAVLGEIAARRLRELSQVTSTYQLSHAWLPLDLNAAARLQPREGVAALCVYQKWSWSWDAASDEGVGFVSATYREVRE